MERYCKVLQSVAELSAKCSESFGVLQSAPIFSKDKYSIHFTVVPFYRLAHLPTYVHKYITHQQMISFCEQPSLQIVSVWHLNKPDHIEHKVTS